MKHYIAIIFFLIGGVNSLMAQKIIATTSAKDVFVNQSFDISFRVEDAEGGSFTAPNINDFTKLGGPYTSKSTTIINGSKSSSVSYSYRFKANKPGQFTIAPAVVRYKGKVLRSKPLKINVVKAKPGQELSTSPLSMELVVQDSVVYVGQQLNIDHYLYFGNQRIRSTNLVSEFPRDRFIVRRIKEGTTDHNSEQILRDGKMVNKAHISRLALFPLRSGPMEVPATIFDANIQRENNRSRGFFQVFNYDSERFKSEGFTVDVKPLPAGAPDKFTGAVGDLDVSLSVNKKSIEAGKELLVRATIEGDGIAEQITLPTWDAATYKVFEPKLLDDQMFVLDDKLKFKKIFEYLIVPQVNGNININMPYSYFDTKSGTYESKFTNTLNINVTGDIGTFSDATTKELSGRTGIGGSQWFLKPWVWGLVSLLAALGAIWYFRPKKEQEITVIEDPEEAAREVAIKSLSSAKMLLDQKQTGKYWETLENAIRIYVEEKLEIPTTDYRKDSVKDKWTKLNLRNDLLDTWELLDSKINRARYAGANIDNMENLYQEALTWIQEVEKA